MPERKRSAMDTTTSHTPSLCRVIYSRPDNLDNSASLTHWCIWRAHCWVVSHTLSLSLEEAVKESWGGVLGKRRCLKSAAKRTMISHFSRCMHTFDKGMEFVYSQVQRLIPHLHNYDDKPAGNIQLVSNWRASNIWTWTITEMICCNWQTDFFFFYLSNDCILSRAFPFILFFSASFTLLWTLKLAFMSSYLFKFRCWNPMSKKF